MQGLGYLYLNVYKALLLSALLSLIPTVSFYALMYVFAGSCWWGGLEAVIHF